MVIATRRTPRAGVHAHELSPQASRLIVLAGLGLFWVCAGLIILAVA